jgi:hypothetical protein
MKRLRHGVKLILQVYDEQNVDLDIGNSIITGDVIDDKINFSFIINIYEDQTEYYEEAKKFFDSKNIPYSTFSEKHTDENFLFINISTEYVHLEY